MQKCRDTQCLLRCGKAERVRVRKLFVRRRHRETCTAWSQLTSGRILLPGEFSPGQFHSNHSGASPRTQCAIRGTPVTRVPTTQKQAKQILRDVLRCLLTATRIIHPVNLEIKRTRN